VRYQTAPRPESYKFHIVFHRKKSRKLKGSRGGQPCCGLSFC
jgi:hypothetical protein